MKSPLISITLCITLFVLGCVCYEIQTRPSPLIAVDIQRIIRQTAEGLAKVNLSEDQLHQRITVFKRDLDVSLKEFARNQKALVVASHTVYGDVRDMTDAFIDYHNGSETKSATSLREKQS